MMGGFGGLNNISANLMRNLSGLGGAGGLGGLGGLGSILGGLGGLGNLSNLGGLGGAGDFGNLDLGAILSQLGNMQKQAPPPPAPEPNMGPKAPQEEEPIREAQYRPADEQSYGMAFNPAILQMLGSFLNSRAAQPQQPEQERYAPPEEDYGRYGERPCDICFDCPLTCPRAGLKLPPYETVRQQARDWRRY